MKIKQYLVITDTEAFSKGDYDSCLNLYGNSFAPDQWVNCGEIELDINVDTHEVTSLAVQEIERKQEELKASSTAALTELTRRKNELLSITHEAEA